MKAVIYYFSGTGNSLIVARHLGQELDNAQIRMMSGNGNNLYAAGYDVVGVVFPAYMFGLPLIVAEFLRSLKVDPGVYIFAVVTFGGIPGRPLQMAKDILSQRGLSLSSGFGIKMPGNFTPLYGAISQDAQKAMFDKEKIRVKEISKMIRDKVMCAVEEHSPVLSLLLYLLLYKGGSGQIHASDKKFWVDDKCIKCGVCVKVCPVGNIETREGKPVWLNKCELCMACLQWCPVEAIQFGKTTALRKRYHHPDVVREDMIKK